LGFGKRNLCLGLLKRCFGGSSKRNGKTIAAKPRPRGENVVDLMDALKKSIAGETAAPRGKKLRKASAGQKEMLLPIEGKRAAEKKKAAKPERSTGRRKVG
jgi:DNA end-binding protein Ku